MRERATGATQVTMLRNPRAGPEPPLSDLRLLGERRAQRGGAPGEPEFEPLRVLDFRQLGALSEALDRSKVLLELVEVLGVQRDVHRSCLLESVEGLDERQGGMLLLCQPRHDVVQQRALLGIRLGLGQPGEALQTEAPGLA